MFKAVFFDLDGTLANSLLDLAASTNYILQQHGFNIHPVSAYRYFAGDGYPKMIERALPEDKRDPEFVKTLVEEWVAYYSVHYADETVAYDGLLELVQELKDKGIKIAVITNKGQPMADIVVNKLFGEVFDVVLGLREGLPAKPDPTGAFMVMESFGVKPEECAFVGDTGMDVAAGVNAGAFPIGVLWGFREKEELARFGAKAFATTADELKQILLGAI